MKAFLLAAGKGKRLLPFTEDNPKPLVKVGGVSLIERIIKILKNTNIQEIVINLHHRGEKIVNLLGDGSDYGLKISYSLEKQLLGTGAEYKMLYITSRNLFLFLVQIYGQILILII